MHARPIVFAGVYVLPLFCDAVLALESGARCCFTAGSACGFAAHADKQVLFVVLPQREDTQPIAFLQEEPQGTFLLKIGHLAYRRTC